MILVGLKLNIQKTKIMASSPITGWKIDWAQAGIKITGRNIHKLRYANDSNLMAESKEELKSLLMKVKEENEEPT